MAAASAIIVDPSHPDVVVSHLRERGTERQQLQARIAELQRENRALTRRNRELERELLLARFESGELSPPSAIDDAFTAEVWLLWARKNHHTDACSCHRCVAARQVL